MSNSFAEAMFRSPGNHPDRPVRVLPPPLVTRRHPIKYTRIQIQLLGVKVVAAYIGVCIVAALYYLIFEKIGAVHTLWHEAVPQDALRHAIRQVWEGLNAGIVGIALAWNHYKKKPKERGLLDKLECKLHIPNVRDDKALSVWQLLALIVLVPVYALFGFFIGLHIVDWINNDWHHTITHFLPATEPAQVTANSLWEKVYKVFTESWGYKLVGFCAAFFFGRRPAMGVIDDLQTKFAQRRIVAGRKLRWYHTAPFKGRYNDLCAKEGVTGAQASEERTSTGLTIAVRLLIPVTFGLACYGWYVLNYIAK